MIDGTITTHADVYVQEMSDASDSMIVTSSDSALLQTSIPVLDYDASDSRGRREDGNGNGNGNGDRDRDETRDSRKIVDSTSTFGGRSANNKRLTSYSESTDTDDCTETIENDVCDASPAAPALALSMLESAFEFGSEPDGRSKPDSTGTRSDSESRISRTQRNGLDADKKQPVVRRNDSSCVVDCLYYTQQCCECVIF